MAVPYVFQSATQPLPLAQLDVNFNTPITVGSTAVQLCDTIDTLVGMVDADFSGTVTSVDFVGDLTGNVVGNVTGDLTGNADTVTDGAYLSTTNVFTGDNSFDLTVTLAQGLDLVGYEPTVLFYGKTVDGTSPIEDGDVAGSITFTGLTSGGPGTAARIFATVDGTVGVGTVPTSLSFATTDAGGILNTHQIIYPNGVTNFIGGVSTPSVAVTQVATAITVDCSLSNVFETTLTASIVTVTFTNFSDGQTINWFITQDATGSRTMGWAGDVKFPGGASGGLLSTAADAVDLVVLTYRDTTGFWYGSVLQDFSSNAPIPPPPEAYLVTYDLAISNTVDVEFTGVTNASINWGDGTIEAFAVSGVKSHTYVAVSGTVSVGIYGTCDGLILTNGFTEITSWGVGLTTSVALVSADLVSVPSTLPADITRITFADCSSFNSPNIITWDTSNITDMSGMFQNATIFDQPIGVWNTASVTSMGFMFYNTFFNQDISAWNTSSVTVMEFMFSAAPTFNQPIGTWNTSLVNVMAGMFSNATSFNGDIGAWDTSAVTNMSNMFNSAPAFNQDISGWVTTSVTSMAYMFELATTFDQPIGAWDVSSVTTMQNMFNDAAAFNQDISGWNTGSVNFMTATFAGAAAFNQPLNSWDTSAVVYMTSMFNGASAFNQDIGLWNTSIVNDMDYMFYDATVFDQDISAWVVTVIPTLPTGFNTGGVLTPAYFPVWGV